jgi:hypothetical protein
MDDRWSERPSARARRGADSLEGGLDRLVSAGRQLVDGVSGARPGSRGPAGSRPRLADLGRWVEDKLDWILEEEDDWREPWQEERRPARGPESRVDSGRWSDERWSEAGRLDQSRSAPSWRDEGWREERQRPLVGRRLEVSPSPRPSTAAGPAAFTATAAATPAAFSPAAAPSPGRSGRQPLQAISRRRPGGLSAAPSREAPAAPSASPRPVAVESAGDWPEDDTFTRSRWQRPQDTPGPSPERAVDRPAPRAERPAAARPLPRSSRRRPG